jgi:hypothetical protein
LANAKGGETFLLATGKYSVKLAYKNFASNVTVTSLDTSNPATIDYMKLSYSSNLTFRSVDIGRAATTAEHMVRIMGGSNLTFDQVHVHGSLDGDARNDGNGFVVDTGAKNIRITNSEFEQLNKAGIFSNINGLTLAGNNIHNVVSTTPFSISSTVTNLVQSTTAVTSQTLQKVAIADATYSAFAPTSLSDTLALSEPVTTKTTAPLSSAASVFTPLSTTKQAASLASTTQKTVKTAAQVTLSSSAFSQQSYFQLAAGR